MQRRGQYQHYVPRFILRHFAVNKSARSSSFIDNGKGAFEPRNADPNDRRRRYVPDRMNVYHVSTAQLVMAHEEGSGDAGNTVDRNYGLQDLYVDPHHPDHDHIEKKLSQLESDASRVFRKLVQALDDPAGSVRLLRRELNTLRKFLFIMSYRGSRRGSQYFQDHFDDGTRADIDEHIRRHLHPGATARDVWLQNIKELLDTDYWAIPENPRIFVHNRFEFEEDMREKRLVFWRPSVGEEFITCGGWGMVDSLVQDDRSLGHNAKLAELMRENGSVHTFDPLSAKGGIFSWLSIFPAHPGLAIALVSTMMHLDARAQQKFGIPFGARSRYHDLPAPSCSTIEYAGLSAPADALRRRLGIDACKELVKRPFSFIPATLIDGKVMESWVDDVFTFPLSTLSTKQTHRVNAMFLENAADAITFCSPVRLYRSVLDFEASDIWDHKRDSGALKAALRSFFRSTHSSASDAETQAAGAPTSSAVPSTDMRVVWVRTPAHGREEAPQTSQMKALYQVSCAALASRPAILDQMLASLASPALQAHAANKKRAFYHLNKTHNDALFRNVESAAAQKLAASAQIPTSKRGDGEEELGNVSTATGAGSASASRSAKSKNRKRRKGKKAAGAES